MSALIVPELGIPAIGTHAWESLWRRLEHALASAELPDGEGGVAQCCKLDFMLMSVRDGEAAFKHLDTRCYLTLLPGGGIRLPARPGLSYAAAESHSAHAEGPQASAPAG